MVRILVDEDFNLRIVRGLKARLPYTDVLTVHDVGLTSRHDREVLAWAAERGHVVLTHDANTMIGFARERIANGQPVAGVIVVPQGAAIGVVIEDLEVAFGASAEHEWVDQIKFLPL